MDLRSIGHWIRSHRRVWIAWGVLAAINLAWYLLVVRNEAADIGRLQDRYQSERRQMAGQVRAQVENRRRAEAGEALKRFWGGIGPEAHFPERLRQLRGLTESRPLDIDRLAFTPQRMDQYGVWRFETVLTARGEYGQLKGLLADIQRLDGLFCLEGFSLTREKPGAPVTMKAKVTIYLSAPETGA